MSEIDERAVAAAARGSRRRSSLVYTELRRRLLLGEYPLVERLGEVRLAEEFGSSRTPVREALMRLESEGLAQRHERGGFYPRSPNLPYVRDLYELRRTIELAALRRPAARGQAHDSEALLALRDDWIAMGSDPPDPDPDFVFIDEHFHVEVTTAAGNRAAADHLRMINERIRVVRMQNFILRTRIEVTVAQHLAILDALLAADSDKAVELMSAHLDEAVQQAANRAAVAIERMMTAGDLLSRS